MIFDNSFSYKRTPYQGNQLPVSVIVNFASDGRFIPIYFKYIGEEEAMTFKIDGIQSTRDKHDCIIFFCYIIQNDIRQQISLIFKFKECRWILG